MHRRIRRRLFITVVAVICASVFCTLFFSAIFPLDSLHFSIKYDENASHFTLSMGQRDIASSIQRLALTLSSSTANFSINISTIPGLAVSPRSLTFTLFVPLNGEFKLAIHDSRLRRPVYTRTVISNAFLDPGGNQTKLFCFGEDYQRRWCYGMNVCLHNTGLEFLIPYSSTFEPIFFVPGARPPPFDPVDFRITADMIRTSRNTDREFSDIPAFFGSRFYNTRMLWHNVMDSVFPTYWTMTTYYSGIFDEQWGHKENARYGTTINRTNEILLFDNSGSVALFFLKALSVHPIRLLEGFWPSRCYRCLVLGLRKSERSSRTHLSEQDMLLVPYELDPDGVRGVRRELLEFAGADPDLCKPSIETPVVLIVHRSWMSVGKLRNDLVLGLS
jgi:hypothetical protein